VTYTLIWRNAAVADNPYPDTSTALGSQGQRRLRVGPARVMYNVSEENVSVDVLTVGCTPN
jgi:mRNA-degrading endonuclease RelE of RelBE toxin-antitoxin system